jgi:hypothetical protein
MSRLPSERQCHLGMLPNERKGMSVRAFLAPGMCTGVSGHDCVIFRQSTNVRTSCAATRDFLETIFVTQLTVGELLLNKATCLYAESGVTPSKQSHNRSNPAILRSELFIRPCGFLKETRLAEILAGHCRQNMVGGTGNSSPTITPPTP